MNEQTDKKCQDCLHYKMCLERFRKLKKENHYVLIDESEYFAHADDCEFHIKSTDVARAVIDEINKSLNYKEFNCNEISIGYEWAMVEVRKALFKLKKKYESEGV